MNTQEKITKTTGQIFKDNICTLFNLFNILIALALAYVHAWSNMFFILIIALNTTIGIAQELKAKRLVEKLSLLSMPKADVERNGTVVQIDIGEVNVDDVLLLESGKQVCSDCILTDGSAEVNESLLTGESDAVSKKIGDTLLSGSSIISGKCRAKVIHVGSDNYAAKIAGEAKKLKKMNSELVLSMRKVTKLTGFMIIPLAILLFVQAYFFREDSNLYSSIVTTSAGLLGMLPKGLYLLISIGLAAGIVALSKKNVLVQDLYSLENLAHVDVLCLDKTGTLTEGKMQVEDIVMFDDCSEDNFKNFISSFLQHTDDNNATFQALSEYFENSGSLSPVDRIPFSSDRKWSSMTFENNISFIVGAPEKLSTKELPENIKSIMKAGKRLLLAGTATSAIDKSSPLPEIKLLAAIVIVDPIRKNAPDAMEYFRSEGVDVKIISGDNPVTVSAIAGQAGVPDAERYIDMSKIDEAEIDNIAEEYSVFGRVTPVQKKQLVEALHKKGHSVAMTGDGVNDLLALREADCSIAVGQGSDAARQVAQLVLLDSDFSVLKDVLMQGRRVVNNITNSAGVFFIKTIYSAILCIICLLTNMPFPFVPIQITLIDLVIEGYPSFFISFEPNSRKVTEKFLPAALRRAAPNGIAIIVCFIIYLILNMCGVIGASGENTQANALLFLLIGTVGIMGVLKTCLPFNKLRAFLFATTSVGFYVAIALCIYLKDHIINHDFLRMAVPNSKTMIIFLIFVAVSIVVERVLALTIFRDKSKGSKPLKATSK